MRIHPVITKLSILTTTLLVVGFGCATFEGTNWDERVGSYTIADAKTELGSPNETEDTADGGVLATWIQRSTYRATESYVTGTSYDPRTDDQTGIQHAPQPTTAADTSLNLIFNDEGILSGWSTSSR